MCCGCCLRITALYNLIKLQGNYICSILFYSVFCLSLYWEIHTNCTYTSSGPVRVERNTFADFHAVNLPNLTYHSSLLTVVPTSWQGTGTWRRVGPTSGTQMSFGETCWDATLPKQTCPSLCQAQKTRTPPTKRERQNDACCSFACLSFPRAETSEDHQQQPQGIQKGSIPQERRQLRTHRGESLRIVGTCKDWNNNAEHRLGSSKWARLQNCLWWGQINAVRKPVSWWFRPGLWVESWAMSTLWLP